MRCYVWLELSTVYWVVSPVLCAEGSSRKGIYLQSALHGNPLCTLGSLIWRLGETWWHGRVRHEETVGITQGGESPKMEEPCTSLYKQAVQRCFVLFPIIPISLAVSYPTPFPRVPGLSGKTFQGADVGACNSSFAHMVLRLQPKWYCTNNGEQREC